MGLRASLNSAYMGLVYRYIGICGGLAFSKKMAGHGEMVIRNANNDIMDIFEVTGFTEAFKIEK